MIFFGLFLTLFANSQSSEEDCLNKKVLSFKEMDLSKEVLPQEGSNPYVISHIFNGLRMQGTPGGLHKDGWTHVLSFLNFYEQRDVRLCNRAFYELPISYLSLMSGPQTLLEMKYHQVTMPKSKNFCENKILLWSGATLANYNHKFDEMFVPSSLNERQKLRLLSSSLGKLRLQSKDAVFSVRVVEEVHNKDPLETSLNIKCSLPSSFYSFIMEKGVFYGPIDILPMEVKYASEFSFEFGLEYASTFLLPSRIFIGYREDSPRVLVDITRLKDCKKDLTLTLQATKYQNFQCSSSLSNVKILKFNMKDIAKESYFVPPADLFPCLTKIEIISSLKALLKNGECEFIKNIAAQYKAQSLVVSCWASQKNPYGLAKADGSPKNLLGEGVKNFTTVLWNSSDVKNISSIKKSKRSQGNAAGEPLAKKARKK